MHAAHPLRPAVWPAHLVAFAFLLLVLGLAGCGNKPPAPQAAAAPKTGAPAATKGSTNEAPAATNLFVGVFNDDPKAGARDPFFPRSTRRAAPGGSSNQTSQAVGPVAPPPSPAALVLKAIFGPRTARLATINNVTLGQGDEASVRVPNGQLKVKCLEIRDRSVLILIDGEKQEVLKFRGDKGS